MSIHDLHSHTICDRLIPWPSDPCHCVKWVKPRLEWDDIIPYRTAAHWLSPALNACFVLFPEASVWLEDLILYFPLPLCCLQQRLPLSLSEYDACLSLPSPPEHVFETAHTKPLCKTPRMTGVLVNRTKTTSCSESLTREILGHL